MIRYTFVEKIKTDEILPAPEMLAIEYNIHDAPQDTSYDVSYDVSLEENYTPLLYPPILLRSGTNYHILLGTVQVEYCIRRRIDLPAGLVIENSGGVFDILFHIIQVKKALFGFNVIEKALAIKCLKAVNGIDAAILSYIDIPKNERMIRKYELLSEVSDTIKSLILTGKLHEQTVFEIFQFEKEQWDTVASFIGSLPGGTRKRNEIVAMLFDITRRDKKKVEAVLQESPSDSILESNLDKPQKLQRIYKYFYSLRYPHIHAYRERFVQLLRETGLKRHAHLEIPRDFENWRFKLDFSFSSLDEYRDIVSHLAEVAEKPSFEKLCALRSRIL